MPALGRLAIHVGLLSLQRSSDGVRTDVGAGESPQTSADKMADTTEDLAVLRDYLTRNTSDVANMAGLQVGVNACGRSADN